MKHQDVTRAPHQPVTTYPKSRTMRVSWEEAEQLLRKWWPDRSIRHYEMAERLNISESVLTKYARQLGLPDRRAHEFRQNLRIRIRGVNYENPQAAAAALGVKTHTIYTAVASGREDFIGLGTSRVKNRVAPCMLKPVNIGPFHWLSHKQAAADLGIHRSTLSKMLGKGRTDELTALAMRHQAKIDKRKAA